MVIKPKGYLFKRYDQSRCTIAIQSNPDDEYLEYRLGTTFLQNFYVGLNFEEDLIHIGLSKDNKDAELRVLESPESTNSEFDTEPIECPEILFGQCIEFDDPECKTETIINGKPQTFEYKKHIA